jgi:hypothetical protein
MSTAMILIDRYNTLLYYAGELFGLLGLSNPSIGGLIPSITNTFFLVRPFHTIIMAVDNVL